MEGFVILARMENNEHKLKLADNFVVHRGACRVMGHNDLNWKLEEHAEWSDLVQKPGTGHSEWDFYPLNGWFDLGATKYGWSASTIGGRTFLSTGLADMTIERFSLITEGVSELQVAFLWQNKDESIWLTRYFDCRYVGMADWMSDGSPRRGECSALPVTFEWLGRHVPQDSELEEVDLFA